MTCWSAARTASSAGKILGDDHLWREHCAATRSSHRGACRASQAACYEILDEEFGALVGLAVVASAELVVGLWALKHDCGVFDGSPADGAAVDSAIVAIPRTQSGKVMRAPAQRRQREQGQSGRSWLSKGPNPRRRLRRVGHIDEADLVMATKRISATSGWTLFGCSADEQLGTNRQSNHRRWPRTVDAKDLASRAEAVCTEVRLSLSQRSTLQRGVRQDNNPALYLIAKAIGSAGWSWRILAALHGTGQPRATLRPGEFG